VDRSVVIVGQGIAGTCLGLELERAGVKFSIVADAHDGAASRVAAGLINPVTGQRFVRSWRVDELLPIAYASYAHWERLLSIKLWHPVDIRRALSASDERTARIREKIGKGELRPYAAALDGDIVTISGGAWVDLALLLAKARERWIAAGLLHEARFVPDALSSQRVILCVGAGDLVTRYFPGVPATPVKGEMITVESAQDRFDASCVLQDVVWIRATSSREARVGATYEPGVNDTQRTGSARAKLLEAATRLAGPLRVIGHDGGVRLAAKDRLPVAGWSVVDERVGILGALGSKGALWAPWLARVWAEHLANGSSLETAVSPQRFAGGSSAVE
jgi:glycine/D-amino acid oxidase-like deaminating enzyme